jgi:hypothetical protein
MTVRGLKLLGLLLTGGWFLVIAAFVFLELEPHKRPWALDANEFGDFLAGIVGPVAMFWLVLAFFIQSEQLEAQGKSVAAQEAALKATQDVIVLQRETLELQREEL